MFRSASSQRVGRRDVQEGVFARCAWADGLLWRQQHMRDERGADTEPAGGEALTGGSSLLARWGCLLSWARPGSAHGELRPGLSRCGGPSVDKMRWILAVAMSVLQ